MNKKIKNKKIIYNDLPKSNVFAECYDNALGDLARELAEDQEAKKPVAPLADPENLTNKKCED